MWLFDTSFVIDLFKHDPKAMSKAREVDESPSAKAISTITVHEALRGLYYLYRGDRLDEKLGLAESSLGRFYAIPYTYQVAKRAAELNASLARKGEMLGFADVAIAATALAHGFTLVTRDAKGFRRIEGLRLENY